MTRLAVDLDRLEQLADEMLSYQAQLDRLRASLDARVAALGSTWTGTAAQAHTAAHRRWRAGAQDMTEALLSLRAVASGAQANYRAAVVANRRMWSQ
jgi:WXG100 family type VII secretion target